MASLVRLTQQRAERSLEWVVWLKARYQKWDRVPSDFNQADWLVKHTALLTEQKAEWEERGDDVHVESHSAFRLRGKSATLAGKPDLIVASDDDAIIVDVKTGREQPRRVVRVLIYTYALPKGDSAVPERPAGRGGSLPHSHGGSSA